MQACRDLFYLGLPRPGGGAAGLVGYDHAAYPGVVPRSFAGPLLLSGAVRAAITVNGWFSAASSLLLPAPAPAGGIPPDAVQILVRAALGAANVAALVRLAAASSRVLRPGPSSAPDFRSGAYALLCCAVQFHLPFYFSRTLPNVLAMPVVTLAWAAWVGGASPAAAVALFSGAAAVLRCDLTLLVATSGVAMLATGRIGVARGVAAGLGGAACAAAAAVPLDTLLWGPLRGGGPVWPELSVLAFNTVADGSAAYDVSPWHWYATSALPKMLTATALLLPPAFLRTDGRRLAWDGTAAPHAAAAAGFVALYSVLPHKEARFLFPVLANVLAGRGAALLHHLAFDAPPPGWPAPFRRRRTAARLAYAVVPLCLAASAAASAAFLAASSHNYPGGVALLLLRRRLQTGHAAATARDGGAPCPPLRVYVDGAAAMTGVTLFGEDAARSELAGGCGLAFEREGYEEGNRPEVAPGRYEYLLTETQDRAGYHVVTAARGFVRMDYRRMRAVTEERVWLMEADGFNLEKHFQGSGTNPEENRSLAG